MWNLKKCTEKRETGITGENEKKKKKVEERIKKRGEGKEIKLELEGNRSWCSWGVFLSKFGHFGGY